MSLRHSTERFLYRRFRAVKRYYLRHPRAPFCHTFFHLLDFGNRLVSPRKPAAELSPDELKWRKTYAERFAEHSPYRVIAGAPVAVQSDDHLAPRGSQYDNSTNARFNLKVYDFFQRKPDLSLLDLGCAGGGLVRSFLSDGFTAVGLEGSDISKKLAAAEWPAIPQHLFTCDITARFQIEDSGGHPAHFDVITAWEVMEHIPEEKLPVLLQNIASHLKPDGLFVASIDTDPDGDPRVGAVYHVTMKPKDWWLTQFARVGLHPYSKPIFETQDFVRGHGMGLTNWDPADGEGFHVVLAQGQTV